MFRRAKPVAIWLLTGQLALLSCFGAAIHRLQHHHPCHAAWADSSHSHETHSHSGHSGTGQSHSDQVTDCGHRHGPQDNLSERSGITAIGSSSESRSEQEVHDHPCLVCQLLNQSAVDKANELCELEQLWSPQILSSATHAERRFLARATSRGPPSA